jgi:hypothetical protein
MTAKVIPLPKAARSTSPSGYGPNVDSVVYGCDATRTYTRGDWIALALAALDQAGVTDTKILRGVQSLVFGGDDE